MSVAAFLTPGSASAENWPGWRGSDRTDVSRETGNLKSWPEGGPERVWLNQKCGVGYSGFAVVDDNGLVRRVDLSDVALDPALDPHFFEFTVPAGVDVVSSG